MELHRGLHEICKAWDVGDSVILDFICWLVSKETRALTMKRAARTCSLPELGDWWRAFEVPAYDSELSAHAMDELTDASEPTSPERKAALRAALNSDHEQSEERQQQRNHVFDLTSPDLHNGGAPLKKLSQEERIDLTIPFPVHAQ